jgi:hypothetical protein
VMETGSTLLGVDSGWDVNGINHLQRHYIVLEHVHDHHCHSNCSSSVFGLVFSFSRFTIGCCYVVRSEICIKLFS